MSRKLKVSHNDIQRKLLGVPSFNSAKILFVNTRQDNVDFLIQKRSYNPKLRIEGSHNRVNKYFLIRVFSRRRSYLPNGLTKLK